MEIRIKTLDETRESRVSVTVVNDSLGERVVDLSRRNATVTITDLDVDRVYDPEKAAEVLAENYVRARTRISELEADLAKATESADFKTRVADEIDTDRDRLNRRIADLERTLAEVTRRAENQVAALTRQIDDTRVILSTPLITGIRSEVVTTKAVVLAGAIGRALDTLA